MADHYLDNSPLTRGDLLIPRTGTWTAEVFLAEGEEAPTEGARVTLTLAGVARVGTVINSGAPYLQARCRVVGGAGKLDELLESRDYRGYAAGDIAVDCLRDAGEVPGDWSLLNAYCPHWLRTGTCRDALRRLTRLADNEDDPLAVHCDADGSIALYRDAYAEPPEGTLDSDLALWPQERRLLLGTLTGAIEPGMTVQAFGDTFRTDRVLYEFEPERFTCQVWYL